MKNDYKKILKSVYQARVGKITTVDVPPLQFLMIDGRGDPNKDEYARALQTLYPVAYTIKFMCKKELGTDYSVMPLEGLWWSDNMDDFLAGNRDYWQWTAMIMQPDFVTVNMFKRACEQAAVKKELPALGKLRLETFTEGRAAQTMYVGPYANEGPTIKAIHEYIAAQGGTLDGAHKRHHEIYLGDPRRTAPEKLKTIIRQPY